MPARWGVRGRARDRASRARGRLGSAQNMGDVHFRLGNLDAARASYDESRAHFEAMRDLSNVGRVLQATALTELVAGRLPQAEDGYSRSGAICAEAERCGLHRGCDGGPGLRAGGAGQVLGLGRVLPSGDRGVQRARAAGVGGAVGVGLSQALVGAGDFAAAIEAAIGPAIASPCWQRRRAVAGPHRRSSRRPARFGDVPRALGVARAASSRSTACRPSARQARGEPAGRSEGALATFAVLQAEIGEAAGAFATSERLQPLEIRAALATNERDIARGMTRRSGTRNAAWPRRS